MMVQKIEFEFTYMWSAFFKSSKHIIPVTHYFLLINPEYVNSGVELIDAVLTRPAIEDMVSVVEKVLISNNCITINMVIKT